MQAGDNAPLNVLCELMQEASSLQLFVHLVKFNIRASSLTFSPLPPRLSLSLDPHLRSLITESA